jgi:hypothetical protein
MKITRRFDRVVNWFLAFSVLSVPLWFNSPAPAGFLFKKRPKPNPAERVSDLIITVKTDPDDRKRAAAASELKKFSGKTYPEILPILIDVLRHDNSTAVRQEAAQSLGRIRPVTPEAGQALEQATKDRALRVRVQARTSLLYYRLSGYHSPKKEVAKDPKKGGKKGEPPLALEKGNAKDGPAGPFPDPPSKAVKSGNKADPQPDRTVPDTTVPQRMPQGPARSPLVPTKVPKLEKPPASPKEEGPALNPEDF